MLGPKMRAIDGSSRFQDLSQLGRQDRVAEFALSAGELVTILEVAELVLQLNQLRGEEEILVRVISGVVGDGIVPRFLFRLREWAFSS